MTDLERMELAVRSVLFELDGTETVKEAVAKIADELKFLNEYGGVAETNRLKELRDEQ